MGLGFIDLWQSKAGLDKHTHIKKTWQARTV